MSKSRIFFNDENDIYIKYNIYSCFVVVIKIDEEINIIVKVRFR